MDRNTFHPLGNCRKLLEMAGLSNLEEASQESKPYRMIRDNRDVEEGYHCHSGRAASSDVKDDLINVVSKGTTWQTNLGKSV